jgi:hypothetical protein
MDRVDTRPVDLRDVRAVHEDERDDPPEERVDRDAGKLKRRNAEPEDVDDEDRRNRAEEVDVDDGEGAEREEDRPGKAPQDGEPQGEDEDERLGDEEDLNVRSERRQDPRERLLELVPVEERLLDVVPAGRVDDDEGNDPDEDRGRDDGDGGASGAAARRQGAEDLGAAVLVQLGATSGPGRLPGRGTSSGAL